MTTPLRIGMVGAGFMGAVHTRAARTAGAVPQVLAASSPERSREAAAELGYPRAAATPEEVIADPDVDVVHLCTPNHTHLPLALAALGAGKHVVCEKPLATTAADAAEMVQAASAAGVVATVPFVYRFHPMAREARARVRRGDAGRLLTVQGTYLQDWLLESDDDNWRVDAALGGASRAFADIGSHLVDLLEFVTGDRIARLDAVVRTVHPERGSTGEVATEDAVAVTVETSGGAIGTLLVSQVAPGRKNHLVLEVAGTEESVRFEQERPEELWLGRRAGSVLLPRDEPQLADDARRLSIVPAGHPLGYQDAFNAFAADTYAAVAGGHPEGLPRFADGLRAAQLTDAVLSSARKGGWVDVPAAPAELEQA